MELAQETRERERGFAMAALLVAMAVMAVAMSALLPVWRTLTIREKEDELMWRGQQYDRAIQLYRKKNAAPGPPTLDALIQGRFLRKKYKDPIANADFQLVGVNAGMSNAASGTTMPGASSSASPSPPAFGSKSGSSSPSAGSQPPIGFGQLIGGVRSTSKAHSFREPDGATIYSDWRFTYVAWKPSGDAAQLGAAGANGGGVSGLGRGTGQGSSSGGFGSGGFGSGGGSTRPARPPGSKRRDGEGPGRGPRSGAALSPAPDQDTVQPPQ
jgi:type II secretory pathway pseudopilin PulG